MKDPAPDMLEALRAGAPHAYERLRELHSSDLIYAVLHAAKGAILTEEAREIVEEAWSSLPRYLEKPTADWAGVMPWLVVVVRNATKSRLRSAVATKLAIGSRVPDHEAEQIEGGSDPLEELVASELTRHIYEFARELPQRHYDFLVMRVIERRGHAHISAVFGIEQRESRSMWHKLKQQLRAHLERLELIPRRVAQVSKK